MSQKTLNNYFKDPRTGEYDYRKVYGRLMN